MNTYHCLVLFPFFCYVLKFEMSLELASGKATGAFLCDRRNRLFQQFKRSIGVKKYINIVDMLF